MWRDSHTHSLILVYLGWKMEEYIHIYTRRGRMGENEKNGIWLRFSQIAAFSRIWFFHSSPLILNAITTRKKIVEILIKKKTIQLILRIRIVVWHILLAHSLRSQILFFRWIMCNQKLIRGQKHKTSYWFLMNLISCWYITYWNIGIKKT